MGSVPRSDIPLYLGSADVLILPNTKGSALSERYTSPLKLYEYIAAKRPIVASALPSIRESVSDEEVFFFEPGNTEDLANKIKEVLHNPEESKTRVERAYKKVQQNTWARYAERLLMYTE